MLSLITTLQNLEPVFKQASQHAYSMQQGIESRNKYDTGNATADIVTQADLEVQEILLKEMSKTDLNQCHLLAEEDTKSTTLFNQQGRYYLCIDPIDDTAIYARGDKHFSTIITLHDGNKVLYMFIYFPAWDWTHTIINQHYTVTGDTPSMELPDDIEKTILYWTANPEKNLPKELYKQLSNKGIKFRRVTDMDMNVGSLGPFAIGKFYGVYQENPNCYDGIAEYTIAQAKKLEVYSNIFTQPNGLSHFKKRETGLYYPGYCLALNNTKS